VEGCAGRTPPRGAVEPHDHEPAIDDRGGHHRVGGHRCDAGQPRGDDHGRAMARVRVEQRVRRAGVVVGCVPDQQDRSVGRQRHCLLGVGAAQRGHHVVVATGDRVDGVAGHDEWHRCRRGVGPAAAHTGPHQQPAHQGNAGHGTDRDTGPAASRPHAPEPRLVEFAGGHPVRLAVRSSPAGSSGQTSSLRTGEPSTWTTSTDVMSEDSAAVAADRCIVSPGSPRQVATRCDRPSVVCTTRAYAPPS
jgi:hypothetical protein